MTLDDNRWWKAVIRLDDNWALVEIRARSLEHLRLRLRTLIKSQVKICNIEELD